MRRYQGLIVVPANATVPHRSRPAWIHPVGTAGAARGPTRAASDVRLLPQLTLLLLLLGGDASSAPPAA